jgi:hypothetical protein
VNRVTESAYLVAKNAQDVAINRSQYKIFEQYRSLLEQGAESTSEKDDVNLRMLFGALNFCFWNRDIAKCGNSNIALMKLRALYEEGKLREPEDLDFDTFQKEFSQFYLLEERYEFIQDTLRFIQSLKDGLIKYFNSFSSLELLIDDMLDRLPQYNDISEYQGQKVYFLKRIQALIYNLRDVITSFDVTKELTALADYRVPQFLNTIGILDYSPELQLIVGNNEDLPKGSGPEIEIRAATIVAVHELSELTGLPPSVLDSIIWMGSKRVPNKKNFHKTLNTNY